MATAPHWTAILSALLVPVVALLGLGIAYRQWRTAQNKLKLDLFDRRFAAYQAVQQLVSDVFSPGPMADEALTRCRVATQPARWLFDQAVAGYPDTNIYARVLQLQELAAELDGLQLGEVRTALARERGQVEKDLIAEINGLDAVVGGLAITH